MENITIASLGYLMDRTLWVMSNTLQTALKEHGIDLPHSQYTVLRTLFEHNGLSQNEIAVLLHKDAAAIKRSIDYLEKKDFVFRKPISGCKYGIYLTDYGEKLKPQIITIADNTFKSLLSGISNETYQIGLSFLESIYKSGIAKKNER